MAMQSISLTMMYRYSVHTYTRTRADVHTAEPATDLAVAALIVPRRPSLPWHIELQHTMEMGVQQLSRTPHHLESVQECCAGGCILRYCRLITLANSAFPILCSLSTCIPYAEPSSKSYRARMHGKDYTASGTMHACRIAGFSSLSGLAATHDCYSRN